METQHYTDDQYESLQARADALESTLEELREEFGKRLGYWQERALEAEALMRESERRRKLAPAGPGPCEKRALQAFAQAAQAEPSEAPARLRLCPRCAGKGLSKRDAGYGVQFGTCKRCGGRGIEP